MILGEELRRAAIAQENQELTQAVDEALRQRDDQGEDPHNDQRPPDPERVPVGAASAAAPLGGHGFSPNNLVRPSGASLNPLVAQRLQSALTARRRLGDVRPSVDRPPLKLPLGAIQGAAVAALSSAGRPLSPRELHALVEIALSRPVSRDTVCSYLSVAARKPNSGIRRCGAGLYTTYSSK